MSLDFEQLKESTRHPLPNRGEASKQRYATLCRLRELGVTNEVIAQVCSVETPTVSSWHRRAAGPGGWIARKAIDRLGPVIQYMGDDLGLNDRGISQFLLLEPRVSVEDQRDWTYDRWFPEQQAYEEAPIINAVGDLDVIAKRIALRFPERQVEEQAGVVATPETVV